MVVVCEHSFAMLTYFVLILIGFFVLFPLSRYAAFLVSNYRSGHLRYISKTTGGLVRGLSWGMVTAVAAEVLALLTYPLALLPAFQRERQGIPIMLVHGLFHNRAAWLVFRYRLRRAGFTNVHTYQYNSFLHDFDHAVLGFEKKLDVLLGARPGSKVILIGHSQGGLICRCVAGNSRFRDRIAAMVTLASPHRGSDLAYCGGNKMARDLIPGRATARAVEDAPDPDCPRLSIYTLIDDFVCPLPMLQTGRPGWQEKVCAPMGHVWLLYSKEVAVATIDFLRPFAPPSTEVTK